MDSPYDVLGVSQDADERAVIDAYRERVKETHPDHGGSAAEFRAVKEAYERIKSGDVSDDDADPPQTTAERQPARSRGGQPSSPGDQRNSNGRDTQETVNVEYLDYEVLDDYGWSIEDDDLFEKANGADLDPQDHGKFVVEPGETLLEAAENRGFAWPFACRGGACTNCAVALVEGEMPKPYGHILPEEMIEQGIRLSCLAAPITDDAKIVYNVKHMPEVEELLLPASRFEKAHSD